MGMVKTARRSPSGRYQALTITEMGETDYDETIHFHIVLRDRDAQRRQMEQAGTAKKARASCDWRESKCMKGCDDYVGEGGRIGHGYMMCEADCEDRAAVCRKRARSR
jgi:hypothetical protein